MSLISIDRLTLPPAWQQFWHWWQNQLYQAIPQGLRSWFNPRQHVFIALSTEDEINAWQGGGQGQTGGALKSLGSSAQSKLDFLRTHCSAQEVFFTFLLLPGQYLRKTILLPLAAEENLRQVIAFELDRQTPFSADQVYFTNRVVERLPASRQLKVEIVLTPRELLDAKLTRLHQANLQPNRVDVALVEGQTPIPLGFDLLPKRFRPRESQWQARLDLSLTGVLAVLLSLALALPIAIQYQMLSALEAQVAQLKKAAQASSALQQQVAALEQAARFGVARKQATPPMIAVVEDLAQRLPQDTWLTGFSYRNGELRIDGSSPNASKLIEILESSPFLQNTHFVSPVTQDRNTGLERFQISMTLSYAHDAPAK